MYYGLSVEEFNNMTDREVYRIKKFKEMKIIEDKHVEVLHYNAYCAAHMKSHIPKSASQIFGFDDFKLTRVLRDKLRFMLNNYLSGKGGV